MFRLQCLDNLARFSFSSRGWSRHVSHQLVTKHAERFRRECAMSLVEERKNGGHSGADYDQCRFRRREESKPVYTSDIGFKVGKCKTYPHGAMERPGDFIVGFETRTASQYLRKPELSYSSPHMLNLALRRRRSFDPLRGLSPNTTY